LESLEVARRAVAAKEDELRLSRAEVETLQQTVDVGQAAVTEALAAATEERQARERAIAEVLQLRNESALLRHDLDDIRDQLAKTTATRDALTAELSVLRSAVEDLTIRLHRAETIRFEHERRESEERLRSEAAAVRAAAAEASLDELRSRASAVLPRRYRRRMFGEP